MQNNIHRWPWKALPGWIYGHHVPSSSKNIKEKPKVKSVLQTAAVSWGLITKISSFFFVLLKRAYVSHRSDLITNTVFSVLGAYCILPLSAVIWQIVAEILPCLLKWLKHLYVEKNFSTSLFRCLCSILEANSGCRKFESFFSFVFRPLVYVKWDTVVIFQECELI